VSVLVLVRGGWHDLSGLGELRGEMVERGKPTQFLSSR